MRGRLSERLRAARLQRFVGRETERALFLSALQAEEPPFCVLHFYGAGGIGKSTLLRTLAWMGAQAQARPLHLDGCNVDANPAAFMAALGAAMNLGAEEEPLEVLNAATQRYVLLIDTYEMFASLDTWLREVFIPDLPAQMLVVTAGRNPISPAWYADSGWQVLLREVLLRAFTPEESRTYLTERQVDADQHAAIMAFTHGHPLALSLVADLFEQQPGLDFQPTAAPNVIKALVDQFLQQVPGPAHRAALEACALVRVINEALLAEMLSMPEVHEIFEWLRRVSFVEAGPYGLYPHELAREALAADLRWRNPDWFAMLHDRARLYYASHLERMHGLDQQRLLFDYIYLHRDNPVIKPFLDWQETGSALPEPPSPVDRALLRDMVAHHEGEASAQWATYWLDHQPENSLVFRDARQAPTGFLQMVALEGLSSEERAADPAIAAACRYLNTHALLQPGERATHFRFWMATDTYQQVSAQQSLLFLKIAQHYLTTPALAYTFFPCADADFWAPFCGYAELQRIPEADYEIDGRHYGIFGHNWRTVPPMVWLDHLAARELATGDVPAATLSSEEEGISLDAKAFQEAVHDALRAYARPFDLHENPLLRSRLVCRMAGPKADEASRIEVLRHMLKESAEMLQSSPRDARFYQVLDRVYFRPARSQEQAAEMLDLPTSTFRRYLKRGIFYVTQHLWQQETACSHG